MVSTTLCSLKAAPTKWPPLWEQWAERTIQGQGRGEEPRTSWVQLRGQPRSHLLNDLLRQKGLRGSVSIRYKSPPLDNPDVPSDLGSIQVPFPCAERQPGPRHSRRPCFSVNGDVLEAPLEVTESLSSLSHRLTPAPSPVFLDAPPPCRLSHARLSRKPR